MKKIYSLIVAATLCSQTSNAQFTMFAAYHAPTVTPGMNVADMRRFDSLTTLPKNGGQGQTWDFSAMQISTVVSTSTYVAVGTGTLDALFTGANIKASHGAAGSTYYKSDSLQLELLGTNSGAVNTMYNDSKILMKWPTNNTSSFTDTYSWTMGLDAGSGSYSMATTGSGNLMLVGGKTFTNVMQLTAHDSQSMSVSGDTMTMHTTSYIYYWNMNRYPLLIVNYAHSQMDTVHVKTSSIWVNWLEAVGITDYNFESQYSIYPNPADNMVGIKLTNTRMERGTLTIQGITGQTVRVIDLGANAEISTSIDVSDLPKGVYVVKTSLGDRHGARKLIID